MDDVQASLIPKAQMSLAAAHMPSLFSRINLSQFYGIELDDFAHEIAILSLWLAEHQMNVKFNEEFQKKLPSLPLKQGGKIVCDNATRLDWAKICPKDSNCEIYILGNPPYVSYSERDDIQKEDMERIFAASGNVKRLDYIACWFKKASDYIVKTESRFAFVSTNSICQGEQVSLIWPIIFNNRQEIFFAHQSFKWTNNAKAKAGVTCIITGICNVGGYKTKSIFSDNQVKQCKNISPYLIDTPSLIVQQRTSPLSNFPEMALGSSPIDGGHLILTKAEAEAFVSQDIRTKRFIKPFIGGADFIDGTQRFCLWIEDNDSEDAKLIPLISDRIERCKKFRLGAGRDAKKAAEVPHRFFYRKYKELSSIVFPMTSSEKREYIPVGFCNVGTIISNGVFVVYDSDPFIFGILSSKMHMVWIHTTAGKLESRIRYSVNLTYNNFPFPEILGRQRESIVTHVLNILEEREAHSERTLAELYDPKKMPAGLREAHEGLDQAVERCYRAKPFTSDEERLEHLFKLYEEMTSEKKKEAS